MRPQKAVITEAVTQFEFPICKSIGLLKVDFLGLSTLSVMREAAKMIHDVTASNSTWTTSRWTTWPLQAAVQRRGRGCVPGGRAGLRGVSGYEAHRVQPHRGRHFALSPRPDGFYPRVRRRHARQKRGGIRPSPLEPILGETYGFVYQEQVIRLFTDIAGYTASEADNVRRGISKKSEKTLIQTRYIYKGAASTSAITHRKSDAIWDALLGFARYLQPLLDRGYRYSGCRYWAKRASRGFVYWRSADSSDGHL